MSTDELKTLLHESIDTIDDVEFLETLREIIESRNTAWSEGQLPRWQQERLDESLKQIEKGEFRTHEEVFKSIDEWLGK